VKIIRRKFLSFPFELGVLAGRISESEMLKCMGKFTQDAKTLKHKATKDDG
jgi:hypothetical protein